MKQKTSHTLRGQLGRCGHLDVFLGFAPAKMLCAVSFADVLKEETGHGYQRPRNISHSRSFREYILGPDASTIPLTFNLRAALAGHWELVSSRNGVAKLYLSKETPCLAQVDCQHRLGELGDQDIPLAYMTFIGLDLRSEMALFNIINSKARGLSSSLTDYHESKLLDDLAAEAPHLYIARRLNEDPNSPWYRMIRYGGERTSGLKRRTSLRMMQTSVQRFLREFPNGALGGIEEGYNLVARYWGAVSKVFPSEWADHRHHLLTKGVGLYALMLLLADIVKASGTEGLTEGGLVEVLESLKEHVDWGSQGMFADAGGQKGAREVYLVLKKAMDI